MIIFLPSSCEPTSVNLPGTQSQLSEVTIGTIIADSQSYANV